MAHCFKQNKPHRNETTVCYCTTYIQKPWSEGSLVPGRFRNIKLHSQACLCVNVNKLDPNNTSCRVLPVPGLCFANIKHEAQYIETNMPRSHPPFTFFSLET